MEKNLTTLHVMRHGETEAKKNGLVCGSIDSPLTTEGQRQMKEIGERLMTVSIDRIVVSRMLRSRQSAEAFLEGYGKDIPVAVREDLREMYYGEWEGRPSTEYAEAKKIFFKNHPDVDGLSIAVGEGAETYRFTAERFFSALQEVVRLYPGETLLLPNHTGNIRSLFLTGKIVADAGAPDFGKDLPFGERVILMSDGERIWHVAKE